MKFKNFPHSSTIRRQASRKSRAKVSSTDLFDISRTNSYSLALMDLELQLRLKSETGAIMRHAEDLSELCGMGMQEALTKIHDGVAAMLKQDSAREYVGKTPLTVELAALRVISEARAKKNQAEETTPPLPAFSNGHVRDPKAGSPRFRSLDRD